ncbi:MAG TPA: bacillithiol biosynthesis deacetylase BshB1 [Thermoanaerobaculia bacterium]|nr:bacillithiol biosynthesis deacetylase BshB1 [Thermoanaerobaculia bacterium]
MQRDQRVDILVFGAHADDIELSCGGTVVQAVSQGKLVGLVDVTRGEMGTRGTPAKRLRESRRAQKILGAAFREQLDLGDGNLRTGREEELEIIRLVRRYRPSVVVAPYPEDRHPDHSRAGRLVTEASFYAGLKKIETGQNHHRPHSVIYYMQAWVREPTFIADVTTAWARKMKAIATYKSQFYDPQSREPRTFISEKSFLEMIEARGRHFGSIIGAAYGEPFVTKQPPRIDDLVAAYSGREVS